MEMPAWISLCYEGTYYVLYKPWGQLEFVGERLVALLADHPDPKEWRRLLENAVFIQCQDRERSEHQPSDAIIDAVRDYMLADARREREYLEDMGQFYIMSRSAALKARMAILEDPVRFRDFIRNEAENLMGGRNEWAFLCLNIESHERLWFRLLELGVLVSNEEPDMEPPQLDLDMGYVYIIDLDAGTFSISSRHVLRSGTWKMGKIPKNWRRRLQIPVPWIELATAYSPAVKKIVLERLNNGGNWLFRMVVDKLSSPYQSFDECLNILQLIQNFLFVEDGDHGKAAYAKIKTSQVRLAQDQAQEAQEEDEEPWVEEEEEEGSCGIGGEGQFALRTVLAVLLSM